MGWRTSTTNKRIPYLIIFHTRSIDRVLHAPPQRFVSYSATGLSWHSGGGQHEQHGFGDGRLFGGQLRSLEQWTDAPLPADYHPGGHYENGIDEL